MSNAVYLGHSTYLNNYVLQFEIAGRKFSGLMARERGTLPELEPGSLVQVTGIRRMLKRPADPYSDSAPEFEMWLGSPTDVVLLQVPPWWNWRRLLWIGGIFFVVLLVAIAWIAMISRKNRLLKLAQLELQKINEELEVRVERRTADLARANAELGHEQALFRSLLDSASDHIYFKEIGR